MVSSVNETVVLLQMIDDHVFARKISSDVWTTWLIDERKTTVRLSWYPVTYTEIFGHMFINSISCSSYLTVLAVHLPVVVGMLHLQQRLSALIPAWQSKLMFYPLMSLMFMMSVVRIFVFPI